MAAMHHFFIEVLGQLVDPCLGAQRTPISTLPRRFNLADLNEIRQWCKEIYDESHFTKAGAEEQVMASFAAAIVAANRENHTNMWACPKAEFWKKHFNTNVANQCLALATSHEVFELNFDGEKFHIVRK